MTRTPRFKSAEARTRYRLAMEDPLRRAVIGKKIVASWKNPDVRARRIAGLREAAKRRDHNCDHRQRCGTTGRFLPEDL